MELTRRDALAALGAGAAAGVAAATLAGPTDDDLPVGTLAALADVVYPSAVTGHREFVATYVRGRVADRPAYRDGMVAALADLDDTARDWFGADVADLDPATRDELLRELGVETAEPDPDGPLPERVRYYVVNDLLYALYTSPTGGELVGTENPPGYPGGTVSYRRPPE